MEKTLNFLFRQISYFYMMKTYRILTLTALACTLIFANSCKEDPIADTPDPTDNTPKDTVVQLTTDFGDMFLYLYKGTPLHRHNFHKLVSEGFYDGTEFHRIIPGFMIQGGDPNSKDDDRTNDGFGGPGYTIPAEIDFKYSHIVGAVAAARTNNPEKASSGSQFYIVVEENSRTANLNTNYTVFGQVIKDVATATTIVGQPRNASDLPDNRIKMTMKILEKTKAEIKSEYGFDAE
jgi:peptidyl-prolyl cis-trans isomerase A (cyclophilin A)